MKLLLLVVLVTTPLAAQQPQGHNCHGVLQSTLSSGHEHPHLQACSKQIVPEFAAILSDASMRGDVRTLTLLHRLSFVIRDSAIFDAALQLAQSENADPAARVLGFSVALTQFNPTLSFQAEGAERPFRAPLSENCAETSFLVVGPDNYWTDNGTPESALPRLRALAESVSTDKSSPQMVRGFARCVDLILPDEHEPSNAVPDWVDG